MQHLSFNLHTSISILLYDRMPHSFLQVAQTDQHRRVITLAFNCGITWFTYYIDNQFMVNYIIIIPHSCESPIPPFFFIVKSIMCYICVHLFNKVQNESHESQHSQHLSAVAGGQSYSTNLENIIDFCFQIVFKPKQHIRRDPKIAKLSNNLLTGIVLFYV
jgi:hypothetical protein